MADYDNLAQDQLCETTAHINGWQKLRRLLAGGNRLHDLADGAEIAMKTGTYTGDGNATKAITGVGFQPRKIEAYSQTSNYGLTIKTDQDGTKAMRLGTGSSTQTEYADDMIISLDSDGFTVGDGTGTTGGNVNNVNARVYTYIAFR